MEFSWDMTTPKSRDGAFRNLLGSVEAAISIRVDLLWERAPEPKEEWAAGIAERIGTPLAGKGVLRELLYRMIAEQGIYRRNMFAEYGDYYEPKEGVNGMTIDLAEMAAQHLASRRAEARLTGQPLPRSMAEVNGIGDPSIWERIPDGP